MKRAADWHKPAFLDTKHRNTFYTSAGDLTAYGFQCGNIEIRGDDESGMKMERCGIKAYRVLGTGRWIRGQCTRTFRSIVRARAFFHAFDHRKLSAEIAAAHGRELAM